MPRRTRTQLKAYYTNYLKLLQGIEKETNRLPIEGLFDFAMTVMRMDKDWKAIASLYPGWDASGARKKFQRLLDYKVELFGCYQQILKFPDISYKYNKQLLRIIQVNFRRAYQFRYGTYEPGSAEYIAQMIFKIFDVDLLL